MLLKFKTKARTRYTFGQITVNSFSYGFNKKNIWFLYFAPCRSEPRYAEKGENWPFPIQALGPGAQCQMNFFENGTRDGTNSGTYCNNYPGNNYSQEKPEKKKPFEVISWKLSSWSFEWIGIDSIEYVSVCYVLSCFINLLFQVTCGK